MQVYGVVSKISIFKKNLRDLLSPDGVDGILFMREGEATQTGPVSLRVTKQKAVHHYVSESVAVQIEFQSAWTSGRVFTCVPLTLGQEVTPGFSPRGQAEGCSPATSCGCGFRSVSVRVDKRKGVHLASALGLPSGAGFSPRGQAEGCSPSTSTWAPTRASTRWVSVRVDKRKGVHPTPLEGLAQGRTFRPFSTD